MFKLRIHLTEAERLLAQADEKLRLLIMEIIKVNKVMERKKLIVLSFDKLHSEGPDKAFIDLSKSEYTRLTSQAAEYFIELNHILTKLALKLFKIAEELPDKHAELAQIVKADVKRVLASLVYLSMNFGHMFFGQPVELILMELASIRVTLFRLSSALSVLKPEEEKPTIY